MDLLPPELLREIFSHLDVTSWVRSKAVSRTWREMLSGMRPPTNGMPWIWESNFRYPNFCNRIVDISNGARYITSVPQEMLDEITNKLGCPNFSLECIGSFGPWLILTVNKVERARNRHLTEAIYSTDLGFLYNPLSSQHRTLPPFKLMSRGKARLSCFPNQCTIALFRRTEIYTCKLHDNGWKKLYVYIFEGSSIEDVVFQTREDGRLLLIAIDNLGVMKTIDLAGNSVIYTTTVVRNPFSEGIPHDAQVYTFYCLVMNSSGQLLIIEINEFQGAEAELLGLEKMQWKIIFHMMEKDVLVRIDDLGGGRIFFGEKCVIYCCDAGSLDEFFLKDCVYFLGQIGRRREVWKFVQEKNMYVPPVVYVTDAIISGSWFMPSVN